MSDNVSFVIPLTPEGLMKSDSESRYSLDEYTDIKTLSEKDLHKLLDSKRMAGVMNGVSCY